MRLGSVGSGAGSSPPSDAGDVQRLIAAAGAAAVEDVAVLGIGQDDAALTGDAGGLPVAEGERAHARPGADADAAGVLLRAIEPVGEAVVGGYVVDLGGGLVVPGAPGLGAVDARRRCPGRWRGPCACGSLGLTQIWW